MDMDPVSNKRLPCWAVFREYDVELLVRAWLWSVDFLLFNPLTFLDKSKEDWEVPIRGAQRSAIA